MAVSTQRTIPSPRNFVAKYDGNGNQLWSKLFGTTDNDFGNAVAVGAAGEVYVTGWTGGAFAGTAAGLDDTFLLKLDSSGDVQWKRQLGTRANDRAFGLTTDASGAVYLVGFTDGALASNGNQGGADGFVVKYDHRGTQQWSRQIGTSFDDDFSSVATDGTDLFIAGYTSGELESGVGAGSADAILLKLDSGGGTQWIRQLGSNASDFDNAVSCESSGGVYVTGSTYGALSGDSAGGSDAFLAKYDTTGVEEWRQQAGTTADDSAYGLTATDSDRVYVIGTSPGAITAPSAGGDDGFILQYDGSGQRL